MAAKNSRDVRLGIGIDVDGTTDVKALAGSVRDLGASGAGLPAAFAETAAALDQLTAATREAREAEGAARAGVKADAAALAAKRDELARLKVGTDAAGRSTAEYLATERALKLAVIEGGAALRAKRQALADAATAARTAAAAESALRAELTATVAAHRQVTTAARTAGEAQAGAAEGVERLRGQLSALRDVAALALGGSLVGGLARDLGETADAYSNLAARTKLATESSTDFQATFAEIFEVAKRTGASVESVGAAFTRIAQAGKTVGLGATDALRLVETLTQAVQLSGASAQEAQSAVQQLGQAIGSGKLAGDELRSILENAPVLAKALADGLGVAVGQLKSLGEAGELTSEKVISALQGQSAALAAQFQSLPPTIERAVNNLSTAWGQYVGEVDKATGASGTAARAITALGENLDTLAALLFSAGKAAAAYAAINLARGLLDTATAARATTAAVAAQTAAVEANTVAARANAVAGATAAAQVGRFAALLGTLKLVSLVGILTNFREVGTAIGEGIAKLQGYDRATQDLERNQRADEQARRANAQATAELAQRLQLARDQAFGLTDQSRRLSAEFTNVTTKGGEVSTALEAITKALDLGSLDGIQNAGIALDDLARKGLVTGAQIRDSLAAALKSEDLAVFRTNAQAAFEGSEQGARRLAAAIDAVATESLRRAGTSLAELTTGFSTTATKAINDFDALAQTLDDIKANSDDAGRALAGSLDKALAAASTERAVRAVIERLTEMGDAGRISGDQLADGLDRARKKLDDLIPGVQSLDEALRAFGLQTTAQVQATAERLGAAYEQISDSVQVSLADQRRAFDQWAAAAIAANRGIEPSAVAVQRAMLEIREAAAAAGTGIEDGMRRGGRGVDDLTGKVDRLGNRLNAAAGSLSSLLETRNRQIDTDAAAEAKKSGADSAELGRQATDYVNSPAFKLAQKQKAGTLGAADVPAAQQNLDAASFNLQTAQQNLTRYSAAGYESVLREFIQARQILEGAQKFNSATAVSTTHKVEISLAGRQRVINAASAGDARSLSDLLEELGELAGRAGP